MKIRSKHWLTEQLLLRDRWAFGVHNKRQNTMLEYLSVAKFHEKTRWAAKNSARAVTRHTGTDTIIIITTMPLSSSAAPWCFRACLLNPDNTRTLRQRSRTRCVRFVSFLLWCTFISALAKKTLKTLPRRGGRVRRKWRKIVLRRQSLREPKPWSQELRCMMKTIQTFTHYFHVPLN